jgi:hypothetical protein
MKRPSFQFYPGDWMRDTALRSCSISARGLWIDMICLMHEGTPYGHLKVNSKVIDGVTLARMTGGEVGEVNILLNELKESGVLSVTEDGVIYSKRMVKDEDLRDLRAQGGSKGGNPDLGVNYNHPGFVYLMERNNGDVKIGISVSPEKRAYRLRKTLNDDSISILSKVWVQDMGKEESELHSKFTAFKVNGGEWFRLSGKEHESLIEAVNHLKVNSKVSPPPASASSSPNKKERRSKGKAESKDDVEKFCESIGLPKSDGEWFWYKCEGTEWENGGNKIKDWKSTIRSWKVAAYMPSQKNGKTHTRAETPKPLPRPAIDPEKWEAFLVDQYPPHVGKVTPQSASEIVFKEFLEFSK